MYKTNLSSLFQSCCISNDLKILVRCRCCNYVFELCLSCSHQLTNNDGLSICRYCMSMPKTILIEEKHF